MPPPLRDGIYEHLLTTILERDVAAAAPARAELRDLDRLDLPAFLARHIAREVEGALRDATTTEQQLAIAHGLFDRLAELAPTSDPRAARVATPARLLCSLYRTAPPLRPASPLSSSTLLTRAPKDPALGHELSREIASADKIDILAAFITMGGIRAVREELERAARRGARIRVLTSVFTGTTDVQAVDAVSALPGAEVRISYDVRRTRLHAKAWLFERDSELHTAYVGSANLTATALGSGLEWMVKLGAADLPSVIDKFKGTFEVQSHPGVNAFTPRHERARLLTVIRARALTHRVHAAAQRMHEAARLEPAAHAERAESGALRRRRARRAPARARGQARDRRALAREQGSRSSTVWAGEAFSRRSPSRRASPAASCPPSRSPAHRSARSSRSIRDAASATAFRSRS